MKSFCIFTFFIYYMLISFSFAYAESVLNVPEEYSTIQAAIDAALSGATILVAPGDYHESIKLKPSITVQSKEGPKVTTIRGDGSWYPWYPDGNTPEFTFTVLGESNCTISGFTITGSAVGVLNFSQSLNIIKNEISGQWYGIMNGNFWGYNTKPTTAMISDNKIIAGSGGGIGNFYSANPTIVNNTITGSGSGIVNQYYSNPTITNNTITGSLMYGIFNSWYSSSIIIGNTIERCNSAIYNHLSATIITNNLITDNKTGISNNSSSPMISNNTISGSYYWGIDNTASSSTIINNIIVNTYYDGILIRYSSHSTITFNNLWGNKRYNMNTYYSAPPVEANNISSDPMFVNPGEGDFHLKISSPCIDAGSNDTSNLQETDLDGNLRIADGNSDGIAIVDMGVYEFTQNTAPVADAGLDQIVECTDNSGALVALNGIGSSDQDGDLLTYRWDGPFGVLNGATQIVKIPLGTYTATLSVSDEHGEMTKDDVIISVNDTTPPATSIFLDGSLGNNNWFLSPVDIKLLSTDNCIGVREIKYNVDSVDMPVIQTTTAVFTIDESDTHPITYYGTDNSGNTETIKELVLKIDQTLPVITINGIDQDAYYQLGLVPEASYSVIDPVSGLNTSSSSLEGGDTNGIGVYTYTVVAEDNAGNMSLKSVTYEVIATPEGTATVIQNLTKSGEILSSVKQSLISKLNNLLIEKINGNRRAADNLIAAFINEVNGVLNGGKITTEAARLLINSVQYIGSHN